MPNGTREIRRRIKATKNTGKITKAMEMVAAAKMRKAVASVLATRDYANLAWATILHLAKKTDPKHHPLLQKRNKVEKVELVLISSNRGLCGGYNLHIVRKAIASIKKHEGNVKTTEILSLGAKGRDLIRGFGYNVAADFTKADLTLRTADISAVAHLVMTQYINHEFDKIFVVFTDFISTMKQEPHVKQLLPIEEKDDGTLGVVGESSGISTTKRFIKEKADRYLQKGSFSYEYIFEPNPDLVLKEMLPRLIEMQIYQAVLESEASEHSARMMAMRNASEAAEDMIGELTLSFNRARQAGITQEISEISSAANALRAKL